MDDLRTFLMAVAVGKENDLVGNDSEVMETRHSKVLMISVDPKAAEEEMGDVCDVSTTNQR